MKLSNLKRNIARRIYDRGEAYYEMDMVIEIGKVSEGHWAAEVEGSYEEVYEVDLYLSGDEVNDWSCTCPYDRGPICKHVVAALLEYQEIARFEEAVQNINIPKKNDLASGETASDLLSVFKELSDQEQRSVKIAAVVYSPFDVRQFVELFNRCNFRWDGFPINHSQAAGLLRRLGEIGFLKMRGKAADVHQAFAHELCERYFDRDADFSKIAVQTPNVLQTGFWHYRMQAQDYFREMRLARYLARPEPFKRNYFGLINNHGNRYSQERLTDFWLPEPFDPEKVERLPKGIRDFLLSEKLTMQLFGLTPPDGFFYYAAEQVGNLADGGQSMSARILAQLYLLRGEWRKLEEVLKYLPEKDVQWLIGAWRLLRGDTEGAIQSFAAATKLLRKEEGQRGAVLSNLGGVFQVLAQFKTRDVSRFPKIEKHLGQLEKSPTSFRLIYQWLGAVLLFLQNERERAAGHLEVRREVYSLLRFFQFFCRFWIDEDLVDRVELSSYAQEISGRGYEWLEAELLALQLELSLQGDDRREEMQERMTALQIEAPLYALLPRIEAWETALAMLRMVGGTSHKAAAGKTSRLAWLVDFKIGRLQAREQTYGKNGWTKGRRVAYNRLKSGELDCMTEQDFRILSTISYADSSEINIYDGRTWKALVGHPLLFLWQSPGTAVQLLEGKLSLLVREEAEGYRVSLSHPVAGAGLQLIKETPTRYLLLEVNERIYQIAHALGGQSLRVPAEGEAQLKEIVSSLSGLLDVQSVFEEEDLPSVPADPRLHVHLLPVGDGFHVELYVKPFQEAPPYVRPGEGEATLIAILDGRRTSATRDLQAEKAAVRKLLGQVPILAERTARKGVWELDEAEECLTLLLQLNPLVDEKEIILEWPKGEKLRIARVADTDQLRVDIRARGHWFEVSGELPVDEDRVLTMKELLQLSESQGQFIELSSGRFLALTEAFRRRLQEASGLMTSRKKEEGLQLHPLAAPALEGFISDIKHLETDDRFRESQDRLRQAFARKFRLPKGFQAELRSYQREGYQWLRRCAEWGVGACLADDMGLGKTIQALAVLLSRSKLGPALVVAPASVCRNWRSETKKFAPALRPVLFGEGDRAATVESAKAGDLIIVTYDLMARESEHFHRKEFATVILDEAQAIKNRATKRSEAAMEIKAGFKMILTGTPLENHLGELWNLFQFINPGLLGSLKHFHERFTVPIEKYGDEQRREQLSRLIKPFMLRRRKDEVLRELPEKTEVTLTAELPPEERAFYEALRRSALEKLTAGAPERGGEQHLRILAELMRLRRAACHPTLVDANAGFSSSAKLRLFAEVLEEILDGGHKALVFSQFVGHLKILEAYLQQEQIDYQYLDGQTPLAKRQERIDAFQAGEGAVFLISLKAGGVGLNLTAADYVIHTDPWWNPAVEDQATDRAHRIGQEKPVTVYRLVAADTIEEKIIALHEKKRDLADSLLAGTDMSAKMTADELLALLRDKTD